MYLTNKLLSYNLRNQFLIFRFVASFMLLLFLNDLNRKIDLGTTDCWYVLLILASFEEMMFWIHEMLSEFVFIFERISYKNIIYIKIKNEPDKKISSNDTTD